MGYSFKKDPPLHISGTIKSYFIWCKHEVRDLKNVNNFPMLVTCKSREGWQGGFFFLIKSQSTVLVGESSVLRAILTYIDEKQKQNQLNTEHSLQLRDASNISRIDSNEAEDTLVLYICCLSDMIAVLGQLSKICKYYFHDELPV